MLSSSTPLSFVSLTFLSRLCPSSLLLTTRLAPTSSSTLSASSTSPSVLAFPISAPSILSSLLHLVHQHRPRSRTSRSLRPLRPLSSPLRGGERERTEEERGDRGAGEERWRGADLMGDELYRERYEKT